MMIKRLLLTLMLACSLAGCDPFPKSKYRTVTVQVEIVGIQEHSGAMAWGDLGATCIQFPDGTRQMIGGIQGKLGDNFMYDYKEKIE